MVKIGIPALGADASSAVADRFARAPWFVVADESGKVLESFEGTGVGEAHGAATKVLTTLSQKGVSVLLVPRLGPNALGFARQAGMSAYCAEGLTVADALARHAQGTLEKLL
jgi:predicted Fe-Mo cluster-binding NifX family protein